MRSAQGSRQRRLARIPSVRQAGDLRAVRTALLGVRVAPGEGHGRRRPRDRPLHRSHPHRRLHGGGQIDALSTGTRPASNAGLTLLAGLLARGLGFTPVPRGQPFAERAAPAARVRRRWPRQPGPVRWLIAPGPLLPGRQDLRSTRCSPSCWSATAMRRHSAWPAWRPRSSPVPGSSGPCHGARRRSVRLAADAGSGRRTGVCGPSGATFGLTPRAMLCG